MPASFHYTQDKLKGFTLVELLVVISIIAILSVIGVTVFSGVQKSARDAKRRGDIDAIAKALETHYTPTGYPRLLDMYFASGRIPFDPKGSGPTDASQTGCGDSSSSDGYGNKCWYCYQSPTDQRDVCRQPDDGLTNDHSGTSWTICANLETGTPAYYCRGSQQ